MRKAMVPVAVGLLALGLRLALMPVRPIPQPAVHDEFAYLLGAETFYLGRVTNPPHAMWVHFETFHEIFQPTYASKYPPAQSLILALGWRLFGHPWYGVWLSCGLMCAALCWMLQGWLPARYALLGGLMAVAEWGIAGNWVNSYMGGAVAAAAGALAIGAVPRLARRVSAGVAALAAFGVVVLANSRPFEGALTVAGAAAVLLVWRRSSFFKTSRVERAGRGRRGGLRRLGGAAAILICGAAATLYYNYRVTGDALRMPHALYQAQYAASPIFWAMPRGPTPVYRHEEIRRLWEVWDRPFYDRARAAPLHLVGVLLGTLHYFVNPVSAMALFAAVFLRGGWKVRMALGLFAIPAAGLLLERLSLPHYAAPAMGLVLVLAMLGVQYIRVELGGRAVVVFAALFFANAGYDAARLTPEEYPHAAFTAHRLRVIGELERKGGLGGRELAIVRYGAEHDVSEEWVFNHADIDGSAIVWARDMGEGGNRELVDYYRGRGVWVVEVDGGGVVRYGGR